MRNYIIAIIHSLLELMVYSYWGERAPKIRRSR